MCWNSYLVLLCEDYLHGIDEAYEDLLNDKVRFEPLNASVKSWCEQLIYALINIWTTKTCSAFVLYSAMLLHVSSDVYENLFAASPV